MEKAIVKYDNYKNWIITNIAYIATAVSGGYIIKSLYDFYSGYSHKCNLNQKISDILKIELAKRKQSEKQVKGNTKF